MINHQGLFEYRKKIIVERRGFKYNRQEKERKEGLYGRD